jgi:hypothetical protein
MNLNNTQLRQMVLLSIQRALLGAITPNMRAITTEYSEKQVHIKVYIDGQIENDEENEFDEDVITQIIADFPNFDKSDPFITSEFIRADCPEKISYNGVVVYLRKEII